MSLTVALSIVGFLVLAAVLWHGLWSAQKAGPRRADPTLADGQERREPSLDDASNEAPVLPPDALTADFGNALDDTPPPLLPAARRSASPIDALIDAIVPLTLEAPLSGEYLIQNLPPTRRAGSKPFQIEALNTQNGIWEPPGPGQHYSELQAGVLLANRSGAMNQIEYSEFVQKMEAFAQSIGALPNAPDMLDVAARAKELDAFASSHDAQLAMRLVARSSAWSVGYVGQVASRHGFVPGTVPGRLVLPSDDEGAPPVLVLSYDPQAALAEEPTQSVISEVLLSLDVPQTPASAEPFASWQEAARALSKDLEAVLVDDAGRPLNLGAFTSIGDDLSELYQRLEARDLAAGSAAARRLFS